MSAESPLQSPAPSRNLRWRTRLLRLLLILVLVGLFILYIVVPVGFGYMATVARRQPVGAAPAGFTELSLVTADDVRLAAWYAPPASGAVIVLLHGAGGSREGIRQYAEMLVNHDFGVLAFDLRGQGASEGQTNLFGWNGTTDLQAALTFLNQQQDVETIGGLGLSLGGEVLLGAASTCPQLRALVVDGATQRSLAELSALPVNQDFAHQFVPTIMYGAVQFFSGDTPPEPPLLESITAATETRLLFITAGNVPNEGAFAAVFARAVGDRGEIWQVPGVGHTAAFAHDPGEYEERVIGFFKTALSG